MATYREEVMKSKPLLYWRLGEEAGTATAADSSGNAITGTYNGAQPIAVAGALEPGSTNKAQEWKTPRLAENSITGASTQLEGIEEACSVEFFAQPSETPNSSIMETSPTTSDNIGIMFFIEGNKWLFRVKNTTEATKQVISTAAASTLAYSHVVGTYDGANLKIYVNAVEAAAEVAYTGKVNKAKNLYVGRLASIAAGATFAYPGKLDEFAIYKTALSGAEILAHYEARANAPAATTGEETVVLGDRPRIRLATTNIG